MFGSSFRFRQKCQQLPGNLTYSHVGLHSDRLAGLCTHISPAARSGEDCAIYSSERSVSQAGTVVNLFPSVGTDKKISSRRLREEIFCAGNRTLGGGHREAVTPGNLGEKNRNG